MASSSPRGGCSRPAGSAVGVLRLASLVPVVLVYLGRVMGAYGFSRPVVIKVIRTELVANERIALMLVDEARIAAGYRPTRSSASAGGWRSVW